MADADANVWALDLRTGRVGLLGWRSLSIAGVSEAAARRASMSYSGDLEGYDALTCQQRCANSPRVCACPKNPIRSAPVVVGDTVYVEMSTAKSVLYRIGK